MTDTYVDSKRKCLKNLYFFFKFMHKYTLAYNMQIIPQLKYLILNPHPNMCKSIQHPISTSFCIFILRKY